ncbi:tyrosine-protein phosphatase [Microbacterium laevaniformans]|uniref:tyrosine-protein phosphatase n=1 Tax=Microbacterium laevaniformans TaxID=36807 RepID=UPI0019592FE1|nr:tyrosine-protein phosphatase [Microbacterium laevaniformans]MBM7751866.1 protein-tyrosine phosphatase [Microbacterium laevaniformans]GLJ65228.1 protein-tyrosine-phosphatase [Microbacterium laevaniformans]
MSIVSGALNFRDVGGLPAGGGVTRAGVLFRSGNLAGLDEAGREDLVGLGIRRVVDLRADDEVAVEPSRVAGLDLETIRIPLFLGSVASFFVEDRSLADVYRGLVDESADRMVEVVRAVLEGAPALVHCTVGKDRTGVAVALLLDAVGVEHDAIVADYARTEQLLPARRNARVLAYLRSVHPDARHLEDLATRSPAPVMQALLEDVRERFGSAAGYLVTHGLRRDEVDALATILIER